MYQAGSWGLVGSGSLNCWPSVNNGNPAWSGLVQVMMETNMRRRSARSEVDFL